MARVPWCTVFPRPLRMPVLGCSSINAIIATMITPAVAGALSTVQEDGSAGAAAGGADNENTRANAGPAVANISSILALAGPAPSPFELRTGKGGLVRDIVYTLHRLSRASSYVT